MIQINQRRIGQGEHPYIIADMSSNHKQNSNVALELLHVAKNVGCNAVKYQSYVPHDITLDKDLIKLYDSAYLPFEIESMLWEEAKKIGITLFASVFSPFQVPFLESRCCPAYKIASFEIHHMKLLEAVKKTCKPLFISTGMMSYSDLTWFSTNFSPLNTILMRCVSNYPAKPGDFHLSTIPHMRQDFGFDVGVSDHTQGLGVSIAAVALGAVAVERHFTLKRDGKIDDNVSLEPHEMAQLVKECKIAHESIGSVDYTVYGDRKHLRSLYAITDINKGEIFSDESIDALRPNKGISPKAYYSFIGKPASRDIRAGEPLHLKDVE